MDSKKTLSVYLNIERFLQILDNILILIGAYEVTKKYLFPFLKKNQLKQLFQLKQDNKNYQIEDLLFNKGLLSFSTWKKIKEDGKNNV